MKAVLKFPRRYVRLLPSVMLVCGGLLVLTTSDLVHEALAQAAAPAQADAMGPPPKPGNRDYAGDDSEIASAAEVDVLTSLSKRRGELDVRESQIQIQANMLAATESRVDAKIGQLKQLQSQIASLLAQRDAAQQAQVNSLVKTYSTMKAKDAARIFDSLDDKVLVPVAESMKSDVLALVLAAMNPDQAQKLTIKLANKLTLPDTTNALAPPPATPVAAPGATILPPAGQQSQATPVAPATQTASAAPAAPAAAPAAAPPAAAPKPGN